MIGDRNGTGSSNGPAGNDEQTVAATDLFEVLAEPSRRRVLRELHGTDGRIAVHELADRLADGHADRPTESRDRLAERDSERLTIRLHHSHLPKLDDCGLADYDHESHTVAAEIPAWVEPYLEIVDE